MAKSVHLRVFRGFALSSAVAFEIADKRLAIASEVAEVHRLATSTEEQQPIEHLE